MKILFKGPYDSRTYKPSLSQSKTETVYQEVKVIIDGEVLGALMLSREQVNMLYKSALAEGEYAPVEIRGLHVDMGDKTPESATPTTPTTPQSGHELSKSIVAARKRLGEVLQQDVTPKILEDLCDVANMLDQVLKELPSPPPEPTLKRRLIVDVVYQPNGVAAGVLESLLMRIPDDTAGNGLFTGDTAAEVKGWSAKIEEGP
jgi:hypothetical protein